MTDDICGAETSSTDGVCQHPAGSCPVPSHSDADAEDPQGRKFALDEGDHEDILDAARRGKSKRDCARAGGVSKDSLQRYIDAHDEFRDSFRRARAKGSDRLIEGGLCDEDVDSSMAKFLLASSYDYVKKEQRELEHSGDVDHTVELDEETAAAIRGATLDDE